MHFFLEIGTVVLKLIGASIFKQVIFLLNKTIIIFTLELYANK